jgi:Holliday junction DNA helicase RuvB
LRARFGIVERLEFYTVEELILIVKRTARILNVGLDEDGAQELAKRSRGTPRIANRLVKRVRDYAQVKADGRITRQVASDALEMMEIDAKGFDRMDRSYLLAIVEKFNGGPVGLETLSAALHEEKDTLEDIYEPYLMEMGFIKRTPRGRVATGLTYTYFGIPQSQENKQSNLF